MSTFDEGLDNGLTIRDIQNILNLIAFHSGRKTLATILTELVKEECIYVMLTELSLIVESRTEHPRIAGNLPLVNLAGTA